MVRLGYLCLLFALLTVGCSNIEHPDLPASAGSMSLALAATGPDGATYRLRDATIDIAGPTPATILTEADPTATARSVIAAPGNYALTLLTGWRLERVEATGASNVDATLVSPSPLTAHVSPASVTQVALRFTVAGLGDVVLDPGELEVSLEVAAASCQPAAQVGCSAGKKCTDFQGNSRCAPDGVVPEGGACTSADGVDDCVAGTLCRQGVCTRICDVGSTDCACTRFGDLFTDSMTIGLCTPTCGAFANDCAPGEACYLIPGQGNACAAAGTVPVAGACNFVNECVPGSSCLVRYPDREQPECTAYCVPGGTGCNGGQACIDVSDSFLGNESVGICVDCVRMPEACGPG